MCTLFLTGDLIALAEWRWNEQEKSVEIYSIEEEYKENNMMKKKK